MKIVHEVYGNVQVGGSGRPYGDSRPDAEYSGGYVDVIVSYKVMLTDKNEAFYIEGTLDAVRDLARQLTSFCEGLDAVMREQHEEQKRRAADGAPQT